MDEQGDEHAVKTVNPRAQDWLRAQVNSSAGTQQILDMMSNQAEQPSFLKQLIEAQNGPEHETNPLSMEDLSEDWWQEPPQDAETPSSSSAPIEPTHLPDEDGFAKIPRVHKEPEGDLGSYVLVEQQDVLDAIGAFVAAYIATIPQARNLPPQQLQVAIARAFKDLGKSKIRRLWEWGSTIYRCVSFSYGAFSVYENPWLVRAVLMALWTASRLLIRGVIPLIL